MRLTMLGVGEAFDAQEPSSAALVEQEGFTLLIDCGYSVVQPLWRALPGPDEVDAIYLTHHHADHILGLVPVLDRWISVRRKVPLTILTTAWGIGSLQQLFGLMSVPLKAGCPFPLRFEVAAETEAVGPFTMAVAPTRHGMPNHALRLTAGGRSLAYSGDGRPTIESKKLYEGVDLLMHECFERLATRSTTFHCDLPSVAAIDGPARIGLYHARAGVAAELRRHLASDPRLFVAEAGVALEV